ncbi:MAG: hypothetical protein ACR2F6_05940 [Mycobacteriales bacterium]
MPSTLPSSRVTSFSADATPCRAAGTACMMASVAGVAANVIPAPSRNVPIATGACVESARRRLMTTRLAAIMAIPAPTFGRWHQAAARRGTKGKKTIGGQRQR